jgi:hypothetical protein
MGEMYCRATLQGRVEFYLFIFFKFYDEKCMKVKIELEISFTAARRKNPHFNSVKDTK